jgi:hypothetical protein
LVAGAVLAVLAGSIATAMVTFAEGGPQRYETETFSFLYPEDWREIEGVDFPASEEVSGGRAGEHVVGIDLDNWASVFSVDLGFVVDGGNVRDVVPNYEAFVRATEAQDPEVEVVQEPTVVEKGSLTGVQFRISAVSQQGNRVIETVTSLFSGARQYLVTCNARPEAPLTAQEGCEQVLQTLDPGGADG